MNIDLPLLERWLTGWSLSRGLPLPTHCGGGLVVDVGWPDQVRRHVFVHAGAALRQCAAQIDAPFIYLKAAVDSEDLRRALPDRWRIESPRYLMYRPAAITRPATIPAGYLATMDIENGAQLIRFIDTTGQAAASGRVLVSGGTAVFDRIETLDPHRGRGLATAMMSALDALAERDGARERLLVATGAGRALYLRLGWIDLAPYSTAVLPAGARPDKM